MGLDWGAIQERYEARLDYEEAQGCMPVERQELRIREKQDRERKKAKRRAGAPRTHTFDHDRMVELYGAGMSMKGVARELGCDDWTVSKVLRSRGVPRGPQSAPGRPRKISA